MAGLALVPAQPGGAGARALRHAHEGGAGGRRKGAARCRGHAGRELSAHAVRVDGRAPRGEVLFRAQRPEERQGSAAMGERTCAVGGFPRPGAASPPADDAQDAALKGDVLVAKNQLAEARAAYRLALEKADSRDSPFRESVRMRL